MPKSNKTSSHKMEHNPSQDEASTHDESSSDQENDQEVILKQLYVQQIVPSMFIPYIEGPNMNWTVNGGLFHRFLKWRLKCKNILQCELAMLAERRKSKKVIAWSRDFGIDQYVSWNLTNEEFTLDVIWEKLEEFFKPQSYEVGARFDLLTSFRQGVKNVDEWCNGVQTQAALA